VRKDGFCLWASVVIDAVRDETGKLVGFAKITRDISERRAAQVSMQKMQAQLAEAAEDGRARQLTGGVAHDFNNLLMFVSGHIATLKKIAERPIRKRLRAHRRGPNRRTTRSGTDAAAPVLFAAAARQSARGGNRRPGPPRFREMLTSAVGSNIRSSSTFPGDDMDGQGPT
jgi:hypothetical protein